MCDRQKKSMNPLIVPSCFDLENSSFDELLDIFTVLFHEFQDKDRRAYKIKYNPN
jgi:hypothetical protein